MKLVSVKSSERPNKRFVAVFELDDGKKKTTHFGSPGAFTYLDGASDKVRENYIKRHKASGREDWNDPTTAGALSRFVIWGDSRSLRKNIESFKKQFDLK